MQNRYLVHERTVCLRGTSRCSSSRRHTLTGNIRRHAFRSEILDEMMDVLVYMPPGFSESEPWRYPVLYLHDGQNVFDEKSAAFGVEWGVDEAAEQLIYAQKMQPVIMVAVANTSERVALYTPFRDEQHGGGRGKEYRQFLIGELKPFIDKTYPTSAKAKDTAVLGSSLGGLSSLFLSWTRPDVFARAAALSPSLWWGGRGLITRIASDEPKIRPQFLWVDMGTEESTLDENENGVPDVIDDLRALRAVLLQKGYTLGVDLIYREVEGATHDEGSWAARIADVLVALFPFQKS